MFSAAGHEFRYQMQRGPRGGRVLAHINPNAGSVYEPQAVGGRGESVLACQRSSGPLSTAAQQRRHERKAGPDAGKRTVICGWEHPRNLDVR